MKGRVGSFRSGMTSDYPAEWLLKNAQIVTGTTDSSRTRPHIKLDVAWFGTGTDLLLFHPPEMVSAIESEWLSRSSQFKDFHELIGWGDLIRFSGSPLVVKVFKLLALKYKLAGCA
jgi:hypothetical protein